MSNKFAAIIQMEANTYMRELSNFIYKVESRFVQEVILGIFKSKSVIVTKIATDIKDKVTLKKTQERLRRHFNKKGFWKRLIEGHISAISTKVRNMDFGIFDLSDIQKKYAIKMEGLDYVHDGSEDKTGLGYWLANIICVSGHGDKITPLYNKLYSFVKGTKSENTEILSAIETVISKLKKKLIWVIDRGGDRPIIISRFIKLDLFFIVRLMKRTKLFYRNQLKGVSAISKKVRLLYSFKVKKVKKNKIVMKNFVGGAVRVKYQDKNTLKPYEKKLWFVVLKQENRGYSWYLVSSDKISAGEVVAQCLTGYGHRWKIEEYHRHIKTEFHLEKIQIKKFEGLQTMLSVITIAMAILYSQTRYLHNRLILESDVKTLDKYKIKELLGFVYYKISTIFNKLLANATARTFRPSSSHQLKDTGQFELFACL